MQQTDIKSLVTSIKSGVIMLASSSITGYVAQARKEGQKLIVEMEGDIQRWAEQAKNGDLSKQDLEDLVNGQITSIKMATLKQRGIGQIEIDKFKKGIANLIVNTIGALI